MPVPALQLRLPKGSELTPGEMDGNLTIFRDFCNGLEQLMLVAFDEDGAPKEDLLKIISGSSYGDGNLTGSVYIITLNPVPTSYTTGMRIWMKPLTANTGSVDVNINGLGAKSILKNVSEELSGGELMANGIVELVYDGTSFQLTTIYAAISASQLNESARGGIHQYAAGALSGGVYLVTLSPAATAYTAGMRVVFKPSSPNTGAVDINIDGLGTKNIFKQATNELTGGEISTNALVELIYDGSSFQLMSATAASFGFVSAEQALPSVSTELSLAHSLTGTPSQVRWVLVCKVTEYGYSVGDEVNLSTVGKWSSNDEPAFDEITNNTNVSVVRHSTCSTLEIARRDVGNVGNLVNITEASWRLKAYAAL